MQRTDDITVEMVAKKDLKEQLQRLVNIAKHNRREAMRTLDYLEPSFENGQLNAFNAVALSYGIELEDPQNE